MRPSEQRKSIDAAVVELAEMTHLLDELVELARGDAQTSPHEAVRLDLVAQQAVLVAARRTEREFQFVHEPTIVSGAPAARDLEPPRQRREVELAGRSDRGDRCGRRLQRSRSRRWHRAR
jgi:signal transduction histidine kinase